MHPARLRSGSSRSGSRPRRGSWPGSARATRRGGRSTAARTRSNQNSDPGPVGPFAPFGTCSSKPTATGSRSWPRSLVAPIAAAVVHHAHVAGPRPCLVAGERIRRRTGRACAEASRARARRRHRCDVCSQTTRLPGFFNHKREVPFRIALVCGATAGVFAPSDFPSPRQVTPPRQPRVEIGNVNSDIVGRARAYLQAIPPAIEGQRGDAHTFRVCCRLVRGFALGEGQALLLLSEWNARCVPPWTDRELVEKLRHARQYGREPIGGLLATSQVDTLAST